MDSILEILDNQKLSKEEKYLQLRQETYKSCAMSAYYLAIATTQHTTNSLLLQTLNSGNELIFSSKQLKVFDTVMSDYDDEMKFTESEKSLVQVIRQ